MTTPRHIALTRREGAGPCLVLLHGWTMTAAVMAPLAEALAGRGCETLCPDLPGHGATRGFAADLDGAGEMLDALLAGIPAARGPVVLVGWSLGALIGWQRLARAPHGIAGMVSLDMSPRPAPDWPYGMSSPPPEALASVAEHPAPALAFETGGGIGAPPLAEKWRQGAGGIVQSLYAGRPPAALAQRLTQGVAAQDPAQMARFWASLVAADLRDELARISQPLLAIHGAQSRVYPPRTAEWIAQTAPAGRAHLLDGAGHAPHLECPEVTADLIARFAHEVVLR